MIQPSFNQEMDSVRLKIGHFVYWFALETCWIVYGQSKILPVLNFFEFALQQEITRFLRNVLSTVHELLISWHEIPSLLSADQQCDQWNPTHCQQLTWCQNWNPVQQWHIDAPNTCYKQQRGPSHWCLTSLNSYRINDPFGWFPESRFVCQLLLGQQWTLK